MRAGLRDASGDTYPRGLIDPQGAVPGQARGLGYMAPTYTRRFPGSILQRSLWLRAFLMASDKAELRKHALARRKALTAWEREAAAAAITMAAERIAKLAGGGAVAGYWPYGSEIDPRPLLRRLGALGVPVALPVIQHPDMVFRLWRADTRLVDAGFGTLGPGPEAGAVRPALLLVPLAAFDRACNRIGWGKGHYDRAIQALQPVKTIGLAFALQEVLEVPAEPHDQQLDAVITEREWIDATCI